MKMFIYNNNRSVINASLIIRMYLSDEKGKVTYFVNMADGIQYSVTKEVYIDLIEFIRVNNS